MTKRYTKCLSPEDPDVDGAAQTLAATAPVLQRIWQPAWQAMQSLTRTLAVLQALASARSSRMRLTDIAKACHLSLATTSRLLAALAAEQLVDVYDDGRSWKLGSELMLLGLSASRHSALGRIGPPFLEELARRSGDAAYLTVRSTDDSVCIYRAVGAQPQQAFTTHIGSRRPLGIGAGGLTMLAQLPPQKIRAVLERNADKLNGYRHVTPAILLRDAAACTRQGYAYAANHLAGGVHAIGIAVSQLQQPAIAAVSVSCLAERLRAPRRDKVLRWLEDTAAGIVAELALPNLSE